MLKLAGRAGVVVGALLALLLIAPPRVAHACSGGEPYDPNEAAAIVEGRVEGVRLRPELGRAGWRPMPVEVTLRVARTIWGAAPGMITFIDYSGASRLPDGSIQFGSGGNTCSILDADPTDKYALIVLRRDSDGRLAANKIQGAAFGDGPDAPDVRRLRQRIAGQLRPTALPRTGGGAGDAPPSRSALSFGALALAGGLSIGRSRVARRARSR